MITLQAIPMIILQAIPELILKAIHQQVLLQAIPPIEVINCKP